mgnify:CR=1 FL=1
MKNISLWIIILSAFAVSCDTEDNILTQHEGSPGSSQMLSASFKGQAELPHNTANPYDAYGNAHNDILALYERGAYQGQDIDSISTHVESIISANDGFGGLELDQGLQVSAPSITLILDAPMERAGTVIENSQMSTSAKASMAGFLNYIFLHEKDGYEEIYSHIVSYEAGVSGTADLSAADKEKMLVTASIVRHSLYRSKKRKDKDWETSVGNIAGSAEGSMENPVSAVKKAAIAGLALKASSAK